MSHEIKFRAWHQDNQKFAHFVFSDNGHYSYEGLEAYSINAIKEWQQYTGLKDAKDQEIYEGDIVGDESWGYPVTFKNGYFAVMNAQSLIEFLNARDRRQDDTFVIGNIYENPGLLKEDTHE